MQIKTSAALDAFRAASELSTRKLPFGPAMAIRKLVRELTAIQTDYDAERIKLLEQYAKKDDKGQFILVDNEAQFENGQREAFAVVHQELLNAPVEVSAYLETRGLDKIEVEPVILVALGDLLVEGPQ